ncbi:hypothetical protein BJ875DRAFT_476413 [Amylocarpus encephaloides]|uniref:Uncharacterized protein n=1 Tax=Amylocarpus encephaloides TaxID=45428 RepID=A0A9P7Y852_9HELO|nr:hypothetical protein BJ875DRAFT_476413 [Amylocarpus encephaloides]
MYGPTEELVLTKGKVGDLVALVGNEDNYKYGTTSIDKLKVATSEGKTETRTDLRWKEFLDLAEVFSG